MHWLDKHIEQQATFYRMSVDKHAALIEDAAAYQELIDNYEVDEPTLCAALNVEIPSP